MSAAGTLPAEVRAALKAILAEIASQYPEDADRRAALKYVGRWEAPPDKFPAGCLLQRLAGAIVYEGPMMARGLSRRMIDLIAYASDGYANEHLHSTWDRLVEAVDALP